MQVVPLIEAADPVDAGQGRSAIASDPTQGPLPVNLWVVMPSAI
jgi:hypothetical protein